MTEGVIDSLEKIDVQHHQSGSFPRSKTSFDFFSQCHIEECCIDQSGQAVTNRKVTQCIDDILYLFVGIACEQLGIFPAGLPQDPERDGKIVTLFVVRTVFHNKP